MGTASAISPWQGFAAPPTWGVWCCWCCSPYSRGCKTQVRTLRTRAHRHTVSAQRQPFPTGLCRLMRTTRTQTSPWEVETSNPPLSCSRRTTTQMTTTTTTTTQTTTTAMTGGRQMRVFTPDQQSRLGVNKYGEHKKGMMADGLGEAKATKTESNSEDTESDADTASSSSTYDDDHSSDSSSIADDDSSISLPSDDPWPW